MTAFQKLHFKPRRFHQALRAAAMCLMVIATSSHADDTPKNLKVIVGFPAGAGTDQLARQYADQLGRELKASVIVENRTGAGGQIAARALKDAAADGQNLLLAIDHQIVMIPHTVRQPGYDPLNDFVPIIQLATYEVCFGVSGASKAQTIGQYVDLARRDQAMRSVGIPAPGSNAEFLARAIADHAKVPLNVIPYKGSSPLITDASGGHVAAFVNPCAEALLTAHESGRIRILATSSSSRLARAPEAVTFAEAGITVPPSSGYFLTVYAHKNVPAARLELLRQASMQAFANSEVRERIKRTGLLPHIASADAATANALAAYQAWGAIVRSSGYQPQ